jgi:hypothetical protein
MNMPDVAEKLYNFVLTSQDLQPQLEDNPMYRKLKRFRKDLINRLDQLGHGNADVGQIDPVGLSFHVDVNGPVYTTLTATLNDKNGEFKFVLKGSDKDKVIEVNSYPGLADSIARRLTEPGPKPRTPPVATLDVNSVATLGATPFEPLDKQPFIKEKIPFSEKVTSRLSTVFNFASDHLWTIGIIILFIIAFVFAIYKLVKRHRKDKMTTHKVKHSNDTHN